jgi:REP element-mobilizing transposase RayT
VANAFFFAARRGDFRKVKIAAMQRYWLLTNTCYGNWLPGDARGFVGRVWEHRSDDPAKQRRVSHNRPEESYDRAMPGLEGKSRRLMLGPPIRLTKSHAEVVLAQFQETARFRQWELNAVSIMFNHFHIVAGANEELRPAKILGDFKSWTTRRLNERFGRPDSETWWTERGSKRPLPDEQAIAAAVRYVLQRQPGPLVTRSPEGMSG